MVAPNGRLLLAMLLAVTCLAVLSCVWGNGVVTAGDATLPTTGEVVAHAGGGPSVQGVTGQGRASDVAPVACYVAADVPTAATTVLHGYQDGGGCVLADAGYLDLLGDVWGCVVQGDGWVELCQVRAANDGIGSEVITVRMTASEWEEDLSDGGDDV